MYNFEVSMLQALTVSSKKIQITPLFMSKLNAVIIGGAVSLTKILACNAIPLGISTSRLFDKSSIAPSLIVRYVVFLLTEMLVFFLIALRSSLVRVRVMVVPSSDLILTPLFN